MTFKETVSILESSGVDNPKFDARELWKKFSGLSQFDFTRADSQNKDLISAIERRAKREPLQYILGEVGFYREEYKVTEDVLIPRADTEILVDYAVKNIPDGESFIDFCTGSGCIAVSTLANTNNTTALAYDISKGALSVAKENAERNKVQDRIEFMEKNLLQGFDLDRKVYAVLSNPPYVTEEEYGNLEKELYMEPKIALVGDECGLIFYKTLTPIAKRLIKDGGFIAFEIGYLQGESLKLIAKENGLSCEIIKDYSGNDRVAVLRK